MYKDNDRISLGQMAHILMLTLIGVGILTLPRDLTDGLGPDGIFVLIIGGGLVLVVGYVIGNIIRSFPGMGYLEILSSCFTKPVAYIITFLFLIYSLIINEADTFKLVLSAIYIILHNSKGNCFPIGSILHI